MSRSGLYIPSREIERPALVAANSEYPELWRGLVASYDFPSQGRGPMGLDLSGRGFHMTPGGGMNESSFVDSRRGVGLRFDGTDDRLTTAAAPLAGNGYPCSFAFWCRPRSFAATQGVVWFGNTAATNQYLCVVVRDTAVFAMEARSTTATVTLGTYALSANQWYHVAVIYESATSRRMYVNGVLDASSTTSRDPSTGTQRFAVGRFNDSTPTEYLNGDIESVQIYSRALNIDEVHLLADGASPHSPKRRRRYFVPAAGGGALTLDVSDSITLSDTPANEPRPSLADALTLADSYFSEPRMALADAIVLADAMANAFTQGPLTESITLSDSQSSILILILELADSITLADAQALQAAIEKADAVTLSDALVNAVSLGALTDSFSLTDSQSSTLVLILALADALSLADDGARQLAKNIVDAIALADEAFKAASVVYGDALTLSDVLDAVRSLSMSCSDSITLGDSTVTQVLAVSVAVNIWRAARREKEWPVTRREKEWGAFPS
ncbi:MAG TPA: hypothetical protein DEH78_12305 [Solibacterales bacterium]|nr:hypothetical protein [Bryobacterales bacterium]